MSTTTLHVAPISTQTSNTLPRYAALTLGFMVFVVLEGAVVRATGSGAGCGNHWPLCNGEVIPVHPRLATIIEFVHRQLTTVCTLLVIGLVVAIFRARPRGTRVRRAAVWSAILLVTEGALGAILVKGGYVESNASNMRVLMQCIHFTNTMLLLAALTLTWWWLRPRPVVLASNTPPATFSRLRFTAWTAVFATIVIGATGSVAALADTLFPSPSLASGLAQDFASTAPLLIRMRWLHPAAAVIGLICAIWLSLALRSTAAKWLLGLIAAQLVLGITDVLLLAPTWMQVLHLLGADFYWIALVATASSVLTETSPTARRIKARASSPTLEPTQ
jgi:cytochrome c oxidase assembly protein subunit 15